MLLHSWFLSQSFSPDTFARGITPHPNEPMLKAAADFDTHIITDLILCPLSIFSLGIVAGIYGVIAHFKASFKTEAFAQLGPTAACQPIEEITLPDGAKCPGISFSRDPYGVVEIRNLSQDELTRKGLSDVDKAILITIGGRSTVKVGINVDDMQANLRADTVHNFSKYAEFLGNTDPALNTASVLHKISNGAVLATDEIKSVLNRPDVSAVQPSICASLCTYIDASSAIYEQLFANDNFFAKILILNKITKNIALTTDEIELVKSAPEIQVSVKAIAIHKITHDNTLNKDEIHLALTSCLERVGYSTLDENDWKIFNAIFNLSVPLTTFYNLSALSDEEINHLVSMRTNPVYDTETWDPNTLRHFISLFQQEPFSEQLCAVYKIIFSEETIRNCILTLVTLPTLNLPNDSGTKSTINYSFNLPDHTQVAVQDYLILRKSVGGTGFVQTTINGCREQWQDMNLSELKFHIKQYKQAFEKYFPQTKEVQNQILLTLAERTLESLITDNKFGVFSKRKRTEKPESGGTSSPKSRGSRSSSLSAPLSIPGDSKHSEQIKRDWKGSAGVYVQIGSAAKPELFTNLVGSDLNMISENHPFPARIINTIKLIGDQRYRANFAGAINHAVSSLVDEPMNQNSVMEFFNCTAIIPDDFETTRTLQFMGKQVIGSKTVNWKGKLTFLQGFYNMLDNGESLMRSSQIGIESLNFTEVEWGESVDELRIKNAII
ncbi:MAG: hypothetical protein K0R08_1359 [Solimicrobium sp.]|jgi:hypothetical protein|nr:hypothetical protein [Solimicrobium sp.]